ncbi:MAG: mechanosensitive ion channel, partial [Alphaproteobacteria bacterium]|nr:mechanosensitive ion channel [Alphaproteobacteria bacterium]
MKKFLITLVAILVMAGFSASAQVPDKLGNELSYKEISTYLKKLDKVIKSENPDIKALVNEISYLNKTLIEINIARNEIKDEIKVIEKRIDALGMVSENQQEAAIITQKRQEFNKELRIERAKLSEIDILSAKIDELNERIFDIRNQRTFGSLMNADWKFIRPVVFWQVNKELLVFGVDIVKSPVTWFTNLTPEQKNILKDNSLEAFLFLSILIVIGYILRKLIIKHLGYRADIDLPKVGRKIIAAFAVWCAYGIIPTVIIGSCLYYVKNSELITSDFFGTTLISLLYYLLYIIIGRASFRVFLTPYNEKWRLIQMSSEKAKRMIRAIYITIAVTGIFAFMLHIAFNHNYQTELMSYLLAISASVKAVCIVWMSHIYFAPQPEEITEEEDDDAAQEDESKAFRIGLLVSFFALAIIGLSVFGYSRLASYIVNRSILTAICLELYSICRRFLYEIMQRIMMLSLWVKTFRMRRLVLRKMGFWFGILVEPVLMLALLSVVLILWGVPVDVIETTFYKAVSGFMVGGVKISLISIFWGIVAFAVCMWIIKFIRFRIEFRLLENTNIDEGTKHSLASGFAYIGYALAVLLSIAIMGGDLTNIALIAGALSVGIGLGLQDIVNNFVSGIIMLIERPIKVGDWVVINGEEGTVKQINIRSTEIETFTKTSVIIPNSQVLSNAVKNLTHQNNWARYAVAVGVAYGSDVRKVEEILLECAAAHPKVAKKPAPYVIFKDFGASSLDFEVRFYVTDVLSCWTAPSDIRYKINERFNEEG